MKVQQFALQTARPSLGPDDYLEMTVPSPVEHALSC